MKSKSLPVIIFIFLLCCCCFAACGGKGYVLSAERYEYRLQVNEFFKIPDVNVYDGEKEISENVILTYRVIGPDEKEVVVTEGGFYAEKTGVYTVTVSLAEDKIKAPLIFKVTTYTETVPTPQEMEIDEEGILTFKAQDYDACYLFIDGIKGPQVESGDDISRLLHGGKNEVAVAAAREGALDSPPSASVTVEKQETPKKPTLSSDYKIEFIQETNKTYLLYNFGFFIREVKPGDSVKDCFETGYNQIAITVKGEAGILKSDLSESTDFVCHGKIEDFSVSSDGKITFTYYAGFRYDLYLRDTQGNYRIKSDIVTGENIREDIRSALSVGENELFVSVTAADPANYVLEGAESSSSVTLIKLSSVKGLKTEGSKLYFDEVSEATGYYIYVNGERIRIFENGEDFLDVVPQTRENFTFSIMPFSTEEGVFDGDLSEEVSVRRFGDDRFIEVDNIDLILKEVVFQKDKDSGTGSYISSNGGGKVVSGEKFTLDGTLAELQILPVRDAYTIQSITIKLIDAENKNNFISVNLRLQNKDLMLDFIYKDLSKKDIDANWAGYSLNDLLGGGLYAADGRLKICFDAQSKTISDGSSERSFAIENLTGFEKGAYVQIELGEGGGAIVVTELGGKSTAAGIVRESADFISVGSNISRLEENYKYSKNGDNGEGVLVGGAENGIVRSKTAADLKKSGKVIELQTVDNDGAYDIESITVSFIDADDETNVVSVTLYRKKPIAPDDLKLDFTYGPQKKGDIDANWAGYSVYDKCGGGSVAADKRFSVHFDWETQTISDGTGIENHDMVLENFTGFENGAYVQIEIEKGNGNLVITEFSGK